MKAKGTRLTRRQPHGIWYVCWSGNSRGVSTGTRDHAEARRIMRTLANGARPDPEPSMPVAATANPFHRRMGRGPRQVDHRIATALAAPSAQKARRPSMAIRIAAGLFGLQEEALLEALLSGHIAGHSLSEPEPHVYVDSLQAWRARAPLENAMIVPRLLTVDEAAAYFVVDRRTFATFLQVNEMPCIYLPNGDLRFDLVQLETWRDHQSARQKARAKGTREFSNLELGRIQRIAAEARQRREEQLAVQARRRADRDAAKAKARAASAAQQPGKPCDRSPQ